MCGQSLFYWIDKRLREATGINETFGGISVIICGDFGQLFPVLDTALFVSPTRDTSLQKSQAFMLYRLFTDVIFLRKNFRSKDPRFTELLLRLRDGRQTSDDIKLLQTRFAKTRTPDTERLVELKEPIARIESENSSTLANDAPADIAPLPSTLALSIGSFVMVTVNLWQQAGIFNGLTGTVYDIIYSPGTKPPTLPLAILIQADVRYKGPSLLQTVERLVPLIPTQIGFDYRSEYCWRKQIPLMMAWARTIHKSQGMTLPRIVVDLGSKEGCTGLSYVGISRAELLERILLIPFADDRLEKTSRRPQLIMRVAEEKRLEKLATTTLQKYKNAAHLAFAPPEKIVLIK